MGSVRLSRSGKRRGGLIAIDPYHKSRRIRNVILAAREIIGIYKVINGYECKRQFSKNGLRSFKRLVIDKLWASRDCNKWQS
jgi:hypothetical protein